MRRESSRGILERRTVTPIAAALALLAPVWASAQEPRLEASAESAAASAPVIAIETDPPQTRAELIQRQRRQKLATLKPEEPSGFEKKLLILKDKQLLQRFGQGVEGIFPKVGGLATGQGLAFGAQYIKKDIAQGQLQFTSSVSVSTALSQKYDVGLSAPLLLDRRLELAFLAEHRDLTRVDFYGLGVDTDVEDRTTFRLEDTTYNFGARLHPIRNRLMIDGQIGYVYINTGPGQRSGFPSTEELFSPARIPGLEDQTNFLRTSSSIEYNWLDMPSGPRSGGKYIAQINFFDDRTLGRHDFRRLDLEAQQYIPFFNKRRVIALRGRVITAFTESDQTVPFYLKPWLGGPYALRGFQNYRFYGDHQMLMNAEYRWEAFSGLDMALFLDAGKAVMRRSDLDFSDLETAAGFGFRFNIRNATFLRLDIAFSHEGTQFWFRFGPPW